MARIALTLDTLKTLDLGRAAAIFHAELRRVVDDLTERPGDKTSRRVVLEMLAEPVIGPEGKLESVTVSFVAHAKLPPQRTRGYQMVAQENGRLVFSEHSPEAIDQLTLADAAEEQEQRHDDQ